MFKVCVFFFSSRRRHTRCGRDWSSDVCSSDLVALAAWAQAWRSVIRSCGGEVGRADAVARYAIGSAVNTFAPARLGDVVRIALFSRTLDHPERAWTSAGAYTTIGAVRTLVVAVLLVAGYAAGALPLWPLLGTLVCVGAA